MRATEGHQAEPLVMTCTPRRSLAAADQLAWRMAVIPEGAAADPNFPWFGIAPVVKVAGSRWKIEDRYPADCAIAHRDLQDDFMESPGQDPYADPWSPATRSSEA